ncbi:unnamed protein product, partial [Pelagomonas calceolata]
CYNCLSLNHLPSRLRRPEAVADLLPAVAVAAAVAVRRAAEGPVAAADRREVRARREGRRPRRRRRRAAVELVHRAARHDEPVVVHAAAVEHVDAAARRPRRRVEARDALEGVPRARRRPLVDVDVDAEFPRARRHLDAAAPAADAHAADVGRHGLVRVPEDPVAHGRVRDLQVLVPREPVHQCLPQPPVVVVRDARIPQPVRQAVEEARAVARLAHDARLPQHGAPAVGAQPLVRRAVPRVRVVIPITLEEGAVLRRVRAVALVALELLGGRGRFGFWSFRKRDARRRERPRPGGRPRLCLDPLGHGALDAVRERLGARRLLDRIRDPGGVVVVHARDARRARACDRRLHAARRLVARERRGVDGRRAARERRGVEGRRQRDVRPPCCEAEAPGVNVVRRPFVLVARALAGRRRRRLGRGGALRRRRPRLRDARAREIRRRRRPVDDGARGRRRRDARLGLELGRAAAHGLGEERGLSRDHLRERERLLGLGGAVQARALEAERVRLGARARGEAELHLLGFRFLGFRASAAARRRERSASVRSGNTTGLHLQAVSKRLASGAGALWQDLRCGINFKAAVCCIDAARRLFCLVMHSKQN